MYHSEFYSWSKEGPHYTEPSLLVQQPRLCIQLLGRPTLMMIGIRVEYQNHQNSFYMVRKWAWEGCLCFLVAPEGEMKKHVFYGCISQMFDWSYCLAVFTK